MVDGTLQLKFDLLQERAYHRESGSDGLGVWFHRTERKLLTGEWIERADFEEVQAAMDEANDSPDWWVYSDTRPLTTDADKSIRHLMGGASYGFRGNVH